GVRVEPGEIENVLIGNPSVHNAAAVIRRNRVGQSELVAFATLRAGAATTPDQLRHYLAERVPHVLVPSSIVLLDGLPLLPSGKVNRQALVREASRADDKRDGFVLPRSYFERRLADIWEEVLGVPSVGATDNFFDLGGHSLLAVRLFAHVEKVFGRKFPVA